MTKTTATVLIAAACASGAGAGVFQSSMIGEGLTLERHDLGDMILDAQSIGGEFANKTVGGILMTGVSGGHVHGEIDATESMRLDFSHEMIVSSIELGALFIDGQHGDRVNERAFITVNDELTFELALTGATAASWTGLGSVQVGSPGLEGSGGVFAVKGDDIFGVGVKSLELWAPQEDVPGGSGSDFGFVSMTTTAVPAPGAVALIGLGGVLASTRRRG